MKEMNRISRTACAALLAAGLPVLSFAQGDFVVVPGANGVPVVGPGVGAAPGLSAPVNSANLLTPATLRFQSQMQGLHRFGGVAQKSFLDRLYENNRNAMALTAPGAKDPRTPKAAPIKFKDLIIQRANFSEKTDISQILVDVIDRAESTLDLALHGLKLPNVTQALLRAKARGVTIRIVMNYTHVFPEHSGETVTDDIKILMDNKFDMRTLRGTGPYGVMHNKIIIADHQILKFGSFNWTTAAAQRNYENAVFSDSAKKISRYEKHYEDLWKDARPVTEGPLSYTLLAADPQPPAPAGSEDSVTYNGETFQSEMWSPLGGVQKALLKAIHASKKDISLAMFSLNADPLVTALIEARDRGVKVRIVVDKSQAVGPSVRPAIKKLMDAKMDLLWSAGHEPKSVMHNKFAVFDRKMLEVGSYNWTGNAEEHNFENANFIDDAELIADFLAEFDDIYKVGTTPTPKEAAEIELLVGAGHYDPMHD